MKSMTLDEFKNYYLKYKKTPGMMSIPKHTLNDRELLSRYEKYSKPSKKKIAKGTYDDNKWKEVVDKVRKRDYNICRLIDILSIEERKYIHENYPLFLIMTLDPAHVIARSKSNALYYEIDNIYLINRVSHGFLDTYKHPVYGTPITKEERDNWWIRIIGKETFDALKEKSK